MDEPESALAENPRGMHRGLYLLLLLATFMLPLLIVPTEFVPHEFVKATGVAVLVILSLAFFVYYAFAKGKIEIPRQSFFTVFFLVTAWTLIAALFAPVRSRSLFGLGFESTSFIMVAGFFLLSYIASRVIQTTERAFKWLSLLVGALVVTLAFEAVRFGVGIEWMGLPQDIFLFGKWNDGALWFVLGAVLGIGSAELLPMSRTHRVGAYLIGILSLVAVTLANFYIAWWIVAFFGICLFFAKIVSAEKKVSIFSVSAFRKALTPLIIIVVSLTALYFGSQGRVLAQYLHQGKPIPVEARPDWSTTAEVGKDLFLNSSREALLGTGPNRFSDAWNSFRPERTNRSPFWQTDFNAGVGYIPTQALTTGIPGVFLWAILLLSLGVSIWRLWRASLDPIRKSFAVFFSLVVLAGWLALVFCAPNTLFIALIMLATGALLGLSETVLERMPTLIDLRRNPVFNFLSTFALVCTLVLLVVVAHTYVKHLRAFSSYAEALTLQMSGKTPEAVTSINKAVRLDPRDLYARAQAELELRDLESKINQSEGKNLESIFVTEYREVAEALSRAKKYDDTNYLNYLTAGEIYGSLVLLEIPDAYISAKTEYLEAQKRNPINPSIPYSLAVLELMKGNTDEALKAIKESLRLKPNYLQALFLSARLAIEDGNIAKAIEEAKTAVSVDPFDSRLYFQLGYLSYQNRQYEESKVALENAIFLLPSFANARYFLGLVYEELGDREAAINQFSIVLQLNPGNPVIEQILENLNTGRRALSGISTGGRLPIDE